MPTLKNNNILILGSQGQLGSEFRKIFSQKAVVFSAPPEKDLNITNKPQLEDNIGRIRPDVIINCAAYNFVDEAEDKSEIAFAVNQEAVGNLASICRKEKILLVHFSSDYVFSGKKNNFYFEDDKPDPVNVYGKSKWLGEEEVQNRLTDFLIFRLSWVFGEGRQNFLYKLSQWAQKSPSIKISSDEISIPTYTEDIVNVVLAALNAKLTGLFHLTNSGRCSRFEWAKYYLEKRKWNNALEAVSLNSFHLKAKRPQYSCLSNERISKTLNIRIPSWQDAVDRFIKRFPHVE